MNLGERRGANRRPHPIGADQQMAFEPRSVIEDRNRAVLVLGNRGHISPGVEVPGGEGFAEEVVEQRPRRAVLVVRVRGKGNAGPIVATRLVTRMPISVRTVTPARSRAASRERCGTIPAPRA